MKKRAIVFEGGKHFRLRLVLSLLSGTPIRIEKIRESEDNPGLQGTSGVLTTRP